jgi:hypothetical protein
LEEVVDILSHPHEPLACDEPRKVFLDDSRKFPTLQMRNGNVPYPQWSAGVKRVVSFAYLIVWSWVEHLQAAAMRKEDPTNRIILIVDEIEAHLHPKWQRVILPSLVRITDALRTNVAVQILAATHSPLVLASLEPIFNEDEDRLFWFDLRDNLVHFQLYPWAKQGDAAGWLTSDIFGLKRARSIEGEEVIEAAEKFMAGRVEELPNHLSSKAAIQGEMARVLPGVNPIWPRWRAKTEKRTAP